MLVLNTGTVALSSSMVHSPAVTWPEPTAYLGPLSSTSQATNLPLCPTSTGQGPGGDPGSARAMKKCRANTLGEHIKATLEHFQRHVVTVHAPVNDLKPQGANRFLMGSRGL